MPKKTDSASIHYRIEAANLHAHLFRVTLTVARPTALQRVSLPVWIPGSYLVREFSKNLQRLSGRQAGRQVCVEQYDKCTWEIACAADKPLVLSYEVYALDSSVRAAWLDADRGFFNPTSLCLRVHGHEGAAHSLEVVANRSMARWQVATGLVAKKTDRRGFGTYIADDYDELADCPFELGPFWSKTFNALGIAHRLVVAGVTEAFDGERLLHDTQKICEVAIRFWHAKTGSRTRLRPPHRSYVFMLNAVDDGYGGLEHRNSTALIASRKDLPRLGDSRPPEGYTTLLGLISHEYFHTWNVKRLRPSEFAQYDYGRENYTRMLWFFEGFTSYYDDLLLRRAGLIDDAAYLKLLNKTINQVMQTPGRGIQSVAQASFDAWVKYYRQDENTPNHTVSYYTKGSLVALCLDLKLRAEGRTTLDDVMRGLWNKTHGGPMSETDFTEMLERLGARSYTREIADWVHGTQDLPLQELMLAHGVDAVEEPAQLQQQLGLRVTEIAGIQIKTVLRGGAAEAAGFASGDEWLGVEVAGSGWRLNKLEELPLYTGTKRKLVALVSRDRRLLRLSLTLPTAVATWRLVLRDAAKAQLWLSATD